MKKSEIKFLPEVAGVLALVWSLYYLHNILAATGVSLAAIFISSTLDRIRNKMERHVFSNNKSGDYMKLRVKPRNPKSPAQMTSRGAFTHVSRQWRLLTPLMHQTWNNFGANNPLTNNLGVQINLSGFGWFMKVNIPLCYMGKEIKLFPATYNELVAPRFGKCNAEYDEDTHVLKSLKADYIGTDTSPDVVFEVFMSDKLSAGKTSYKSAPNRFSMIIPRTGYPEGQLDLTAAIDKTVGLWKDNDLDRMIYFKVRQVNLFFGTTDAWQVLGYQDTGEEVLQ